MTWLRRLLLLLAVMAAPAQAGPAPITMALWDFDNNTPGALETIQSVDHLRRVLLEMLLARLAQSPGLRMVERLKLRELLEEQKLGSTELVEQDSRVRLGSILGAKRMVLGDFVLFGATLRLDVRVVDVETSQVLISEPLTGPINEVMESMADMADTIAMKLDVKLEQPAAASTDATVWAQYDQGLAQMDAKRFDQAVDIFKGILTRNGDFAPAQRQLVLALERLARQ
jgi:curli biogenesis system outer membrane secretion channel CsgG